MLQWTKWHICLPCRDNKVQNNIFFALQCNYNKLMYSLIKKKCICWYSLHSKEINLKDQPRYQTSHNCYRKPEDEPRSESYHRLSIRHPVWKEHNKIVTELKSSVNFTSKICFLGKKLNILNKLRTTQTILTCILHPLL